MRLLVLSLLLAAALPAHGQPPSPTEANLSPEENTLRSARVPATGPGLVDFFNHRAQRTAQASLILDLLRDLGGKTPEASDRAFGKLVQLGPVAVPLLRQAASAVDEPETAPRAKECLRFIEGEENPALIVAAARMLVRSAPEGAVDALLAYLPVADSPKLYQEVETALVEIVLRDRKAVTPLTRALKDSQPGLRAAAASVLCQVGDPAARAAVKPLLKDARPIVRLRAALGLAQRNDIEAIPILIDLLPEVPEDFRAQIDEFLVDLADDWKVELPQGNAPLMQKLRREVWLGWWKGTDGKTLLEEFRQRTLSNEDRDRVLALVRELGKDNERERQQAMTNLVNFGPRALPLLRQAIEDSNLKVSDGARRCVDQLQKDSNAPLPAVAVRLLAMHRPEGTARALLAFLPFADSEPLSDALVQVLPDVVAGKDGKADPAFLEALADPLPARRIAAAEALAVLGGQQAALRKLLEDRDVEVKLKTALALAKAGERDVMPALIQTVSEAPLELAWLGDEYLSRLAGSKRPAVVPGREAEAQKKYREAWAAWWKEQGEKAVLVERKGPTRLLGNTLVVEQHNQFTGNGRVLELDPAGKILWEINGLGTPMDARVLPGDRVLIAEQNMNRVSERDLKGNVKWEKAIAQPIVAERLRNGNTFIVRRNGILEVDSEGREVYHLQRNSDYIMGGARLRDGTVAFVNNNLMYVRLDRSGRELKSFRIPQDPSGNIFPWILPSGNVLLGMYNGNRVIELNRDGQTVWEGRAQWPYLSTRVAKGSVLVCSVQSRKITEIDRSGKVLREMSVNMQPYKAERR